MCIYYYEANRNKFILSDNLIDKKGLFTFMKQYSADGLIIYKNNPLEMIVYNKDSSLADMCGNGLRCFLHHGLIKGDLLLSSYNVKTKKGYIKCELLSQNPFTCITYMKVDYHFPYKKDVIPFFNEYLIVYTVFVETLSHVIIVKNFSQKELIVNRIKNHFKNYGNISLVKIISSEVIEVITYERGVGFTLSCASSSSGAYYVLKNKKLVADQVLIKNIGGNLNAKFVDDSIALKGGINLWKQIN